MSYFVTEEKLFQSWEASPEPDVGSPEGTTIFEDNGISKYLWNSDNSDEWIHSDTAMKIRE